MSERHHRRHATLHSSLTDAVLEGALMGLLAGVALLVLLSDLRELLVGQAGIVALGSYLFVCAQCGAVLTVIGLVAFGIPATRMVRWGQENGRAEHSRHNW